MDAWLNEDSVELYPVTSKKADHISMNSPLNEDSIELYYV